tara:strand:+ start:332 stop:706 length:375 start_codon:yes stop_codon:yes gene_type:complete
MKKYHSWLDISLGSIISQPMQRILCNDLANKLKGKIIFELGEDVEFKNYNLQLRNMLKNQLDVDGFIFLRLEQFISTSKLNIELISKMLNNNYELHFIRQNLSLLNKSDLKKNMKNLIIFNDII